MKTHVRLQLACCIALIACSCANLQRAPANLGAPSGILGLQGYAAVEPIGAPLVCGKTYIDSWVQKVSIEPSGTNGVVLVTLHFLPHSRSWFEKVRHSDKWWEASPRFRVCSPGKTWAKFSKDDPFPESIIRTCPQTQARELVGVLEQKEDRGQVSNENRRDL